MNMFLKLASAAALLAAPAAANAAVTIQINELGSNVVVGVFGSLDLDGLTSAGTFRLDTGVRGTAAYVGSGPTDQLVTGYSGFTGPESIGPSTTFFATSTSSGDAFAFNGGTALVFVDPNYVSDDSLVNQSTFLGTTINALGLTTGTYVYSSANDTITVIIGPSVPEPATWAMMIGGFGLAGGALRRRATRTAVHYA